MEKVWVYNEIPEENVERLSETAGVSRLLAKVFLSRGMDDAEEIKRFLEPSMDDLHSPFLLKDMDRAVERISRAVKNREKILIYGDYDVDGVTSTSILYDFLSAQGADVDFYIPDRMVEGYGLTLPAVDKVLRRGAELIITVDCGITAFEEIKHIRAHNVDIVVTDHHDCKEELPEACALVNPHRHDCAYPFKELAGVGIAYKLIGALCSQMGIEDVSSRYLDLVALGTVADVVLLQEENRAIVKYGIQAMENTTNVGMQALLSNAGLKDKPVTSWSLSFVLAPRINAAGRIGDAARAVRLFTTSHGQEAQDIVLELNEQNRFRQETETEIFRQAVELVEAGALDREKVIVVWGEGWHHGVVGIVASKITERYYRPCVLISVEGDLAKGSGRSIEGFDMFKAFVHCEDLLERYGGHELAAGLSLKSGNLEAFREAINLYAESALDERDMIPRLKIDAEIDRNDAKMESVRELDRLAPFGAGNPAPLFACNSLKIAEIRTVGEDRHLKLKLEDKGLRLDAIGFNMGAMISSLSASDLLDVAGSLEINSWNSTDRVQWNLRDIRLNQEAAMEEKYFYSLDRCIQFGSPQEDTADEAVLKEIYVADCETGMEDRLDDMVKEGKKTAILVNSLESVKRLERMLKKSTQNIKKSYKVCYTDFISSNSDGICILVNPDPDSIGLEGFGLVAFYGRWLDRAYLSRLVRKADREKICFYADKKESCMDADMIIPGRQDLAAVYRHIKASRDGCLVTEDLFALARDIAGSYKIRTNYFKVKKSIEVLEELGLLKKEARGKRGMSVTVAGNGKEKSDLESSKLYRRLQALRENLGGQIT